ncbi:Aste57867_7177 [Aphanomyces stellatus]|uniref:Aste57867_7177 protein n=1 Tax=Aphanomyces stellatus TaxID=120398 RepID=A0A485KF47_9STRA|nr:hypothetical protein As57867_007152 [Aphanomyces stellatus]VFT84105.1 Aste57867_7177 [Aphanomyces stellatus]
MKELPGCFGKAKPLPGQEGYKSKASDRLEQEARAMEAQLKQVKLGMAHQDELREKDKSKMKGGNRWRSAREDRGSVRQYAQDVKTKAATKSAKRQKPKPSTNNKPGVHEWSVGQVTEWLNTLGLGHHASTFEFNEIAGSVLLDLTPADLDYLKVQDVGERKLVLQHVEQLKRTMTGSTNQRPPPPPRDIVDDKLHDAPIKAKANAATHWSQLKPLAEKTVVGDGAPPVNLADGDFNEDSSHESFLKALLDWRASDQDATQANDLAGDSGFWTNPLADQPQKPGGKLLAGDFDEEQSHAGFLAALQAWRGATPPASSSSNNQRPEQATASTGSPVEAKQSCWHCYKLVRAGAVVRDPVSSKSFCSSTCQEKFHTEYARFYKEG